MPIDPREVIEDAVWRALDAGMSHDDIKQMVQEALDEDDETDECGTEPKEEDPDPFEHGSNGTGQDSSTTDEPDT